MQNQSETLDSDSASLGSNPSPPASVFNILRRRPPDRPHACRPHVGTRAQVSKIFGAGGGANYPQQRRNRATGRAAPPTNGESPVARSFESRRKRILTAPDERVPNEHQSQLPAPHLCRTARGGGGWKIGTAYLSASKRSSIISASPWVVDPRPPPARRLMLPTSAAFS